MWVSHKPPFLRQTEDSCRSPHPPPIRLSHNQSHNQHLTTCQRGRVLRHLSGMTVGYARVSTLDQTLDLQKDALTHAGCGRIFTDTMSGAKAERPGLVQALAFMRAGDVLVVWKLDRLGRSLKNLIDVVTELDTLGIGFRSITESMDTTTSGGRLIFHIFGALAEFERNLIRERTLAGLSAARARGRKGGRPRVAGLNDEWKVAMAQTLYNDKSTPIRDICKTLNISRATLYRYISAQSSRKAEHSS
jgi:DNA invertase Pin-like site-specific DNA recombinase